MNYDHRQRRVLVTGISGSGKSSLALHLAREWPARWKFCFDPDREFGRKLGWPVAITADEIARLASQFRPVSFDPVPSFGSNLETGLDWFCDLVMKMARKVHGEKLLCVDEIWKYTGRTLPASLKAIGHEGRRQEIDSMILSQQLNETNASLRGQTTELWTFLQHERRPLEWLEDAGFDPSEVQRLRWPGGFMVKDTLRREFRRGFTTKRGVPVFTTQKEPRIKVA